MAQDEDLCSNTKFIDIDFEELMISKREIILNTPKMRDMLSINSDPPSEKGVILESEEYVALGCDLRNLRRLERLLGSVVDIEQCLVLCLAEVSVTYMATKDADALIEWTTTLSPGLLSTFQNPVPLLTPPRCDVLYVGATVSRSAGQSVHSFHVETLC